VDGSFKNFQNMVVKILKLTQFFFLLLFRGKIWIQKCQTDDILDCHLSDSIVHNKAYILSLVCQKNKIEKLNFIVYICIFTGNLYKRFECEVHTC
jgi:hypothetical protein